MKSDKKSNILRRLEGKSNPVSIQELIQMLGEGFPRRSLQRELSELVKEGLIERLGYGRITKYRLLLKGSQLSKMADVFCFGSESMPIIDKIRTPIYKRVPVTYKDEWVESYQPNSTFYIPTSEREHLHKVGKRSQGKEPSAVYAHKIFNRFLIDLSYNSSRLEGCSYSLIETQNLLLEGKVMSGKRDEDKIMILNHKEAIRYLVDNALRLQVNIETLYTLHYLLSDALVGPSYSGKIRDCAVRIGGSPYIPLEGVSALRSRLERIVKKAVLIEDPFEQSIFLLIHISYLQAFIDVNKRTARLSSNIPLVKNNLVPIVFHDVKKEDYVSSMLAVYELQDVRPLVDLYVFTYTQTAKIYDATVESLGSIDVLRAQYRQERRELIRAIIIKQIVGGAMRKWVYSRLAKRVKEEDRLAVFEDVMEDLKTMDLSRIAGLGITLEELNRWIDLRNREKEK